MKFLAIKFSEWAELAFLIAVFIAVCLVSGCNYQGFCDYDHPHLKTVEVEVVFDWSNAPEANPSSVGVYFFPVDGDPLQTRGSFKYHREFTSKKDGKIVGGKIKLPVAGYDIICVNSDIEDAATFKNVDEFTTFEITSHPQEMLNSQGILVSSLPRAKGVEDEPIIRALGMQLYSVSKRNVRVALEDTSRVINLAPAPITSHCTITLGNNAHLNNVLSVSGTLSSMIGSYMAGTATLISDKKTIMFEQEKSGESIITGSFWTFGHCPAPDSDVKHIYTIYAELRDGSKKYHSWDVTDQIHNAEDPYNITILLNDGLDWPSGGGGAGGIHVDVNEWGDIIPIDIQM